MKKTINTILLFLIIISISLSFITNAFATSGTMDVKQFIGKESPVDEETQKASHTVIGVLRIVGGTVAIVMLLIIAARYMASAPGDRADIKKHAVAYVIGAVILFGVPAFLSVLVRVADALVQLD